jgi:hypothetical protein
MDRQSNNPTSFLQHKHSLSQLAEVKRSKAPSETAGDGVAAFIHMNNVFLCSKTDCRIYPNNPTFESEHKNPLSQLAEMKRSKAPSETAVDGVATNI